VLSRYASQEGIVDQADLSGEFKTGSIKHSIAGSLEYTWEKSYFGGYVANAATNTALPASVP
jgi:catecholate siderophore receptor